jgi:DNA mismatch repair protein MutS
MGARKLRDWLSQPLANATAIRRRQDVVAAWVQNPPLLEQFREQLEDIRDLERTLSRLSTGAGNARDLLALRLALLRLPALRQVLRELIEAQSRATEPTLLPPEPPPPDQPPSLLEELTAQITELPAVADLIGRAIVEDPPLALKEGGLIRDGFNPQLDELRDAMRGGKDWIAQLQQREIERTGIASLKVRFNSVFGYYIEITKANLDKVPPEYQRKQTIANGERFITPELKQMEAKILGAEERAARLEYELFQEVRGEVLRHLPALQQTAAALAQLDVLATFAENARLFQYCRPDVRDEGILSIRDGRHPMLEQTLVEERFVPNDVFLDGVNRQIALITGPNMAGKSTYLRQVALLVLLAHTGSFIPATEARIDLVDRIFTRIGASDDLARGQSTFMVEMSETANILNNATRRSLIILDEIGRGTSTFDGLSLAWSIVEHLHNVVGAKVLFATHYHELTELASLLPKVANASMAVKEWQGKVFFLHRVVPGPADRSYGIHVARLAGVPEAVCQRAEAILLELSTKNERLPQPAAPVQQLSLFAEDYGWLAERLRHLQLEHLTPLQALNLLAQLKEEVSS